MAVPFTSGPQGPFGPPTRLTALEVAGVPIISSGTLPVSGNYFFVSSTTGSDGNSGKFNAPYATTTQALTQCVADRGDVICYLSGHAETITAAAGIAVSIAGVTLISLGNGNDRATFTFSTATTASLRVTGANVSILNVIGVSGIDQLTSPFDIRAAGFTGNIEWQDSASNVEAVTAVVCTAAANRLTLNLVYRGQAGGSHCVSGVQLNGSTGAVIYIDAYGKASTAWVNFVTVAVVDVEVYGYMYNSGTTTGAKDIVDTITGSTWFGYVYDGAAGATFAGGSAVAWASQSASTGNASAATAAAGAFRIAKTGTITASTALTTGASPVTIFTVTGDVIARVFAVVGTALTSTGATGTLSVGVSGAVTALLGTTTVDGTALHTAGGVWTGATSSVGAGTTTAAVFSNTALNFAVVGAGSAITVTVATNSMTAGTIVFYCEWLPLSATGNVVNAV